MATLLDNFKNIFKKSQKTAQAFNRVIYNYLGDTLVWNEESDETYINKGYRFNSTIYSIVNLIAKSASTIPFQIYEVKSQNDLKRYKALTSGDFKPSAIHKANFIKKNTLVELENTELHKILERPNPAQSYSSFISEIIAFGKLTGNRYIWGISPETGQNQGVFKELYVLPSQVTEINSGGIFDPVKEYTLEYNGQYKIPAEQVLHIKDFNPYYDGTGSHLYGMSPLRAGLRSLDTNNEAVTTGVRYLQNQTARGVLMSDEGDITETQAMQLKDKFRSQYQGSNNGGDVVITPKKLSWINFGLSASDLSLIEQYNASIKDLCNIYNVPVQLLNNTDASTYNNMKEAKKALYQNAVIPEMTHIRDELNRWLTPQYGDNLYIDFDFSVIPELQEEMDKVVDQVSQAWWLTPNEKRTAMNYGVDEDTSEMNDYFIPANLVPLSNEVDLPFVQNSEDAEYTIKREIRTDVYTTQEEAEARAEELGGLGFHRHREGEGYIYMPFRTHAEYERALEENDQKQEISDRLRTSLQNKVDDHNEKVGDDKTKRTTVRTLFAVYRRGIGAYRTNPQSVRPTVSSPEQWAMARVNSYLFALRNGRFRSGKHDTDLLPEGHPMSSKKNLKNESYDNYPQGATNNAKRMLEWREKYGRDVVRGGTEVGWKRANQLANREPLSLDTVKRINSFLARHEENAKIDPKFKDEPWRDRGYVAYNLWGGKAMVSWAKRISEQSKD